MTFAYVILLRGAIFAFNCCSSRRQNCWELFLIESSRKLSKQNTGAGEFSTSSLIPPRKRQNKTLTETINKSRRRCGRGVNTFDQCSQISWFITKSAILSMSLVTKISAPWQVTRALKSVILGIPWEIPRKIGKSHYFCPKNTKIFHSKLQTKTFSKKFVIFPRFWGLLLVIIVIFWVFFCSWFSWLFCLEVGIFKKNHLGTLTIKQMEKTEQKLH